MIMVIIVVVVVVIEQIVLRIITNINNFTLHSFIVIHTTLSHGT